MAFSPDRIAFLVCSERSGSNLISAMLDSHSRIVSPSPYHIGRDVGRHLHTFGAPLDDERWGRIAEFVRKRVEQWVGAEGAQGIHGRILDRSTRDFGSLIEAVYGPLLEDSDDRLLFLKENHAHQQAFFLLHHFPRAKFVYQVRDPRDYLVSLRARREGRLGNKYGSTRHSLEVWRDDQVGALRMLAHLGPERVFLQRYEDLITDPPQVLNALCEFLGVEYEPGMLDFHQRDDIKQIAKTGGPRENLSRPVMADNSKKYRSALSKRLIRIVEHYVGDVMEQIGYERDFPRAPSALWRSLWPQLTEPWERLANADRAPMYKDGAERTLAQSAERVSIPYETAPLPRAAPTSSSTPPPGSVWRLADGFLRASEAAPDRPALTVEGRTLSYRELRREAERIAARIAEVEGPDTAPVTAILAERSWVAYAAVLAALMRGHAYVPLNPRFPPARNRAILRRSGASALIVDPASSTRLDEVLDNEARERLALVLDSPSPAIPGDSGDRGDGAVALPPRLHDNHVAYILFTSGSTGEPKGVPVTHANVAPYVDFAVTHLDVRPDDRFSQTFDLTFDLSVHDLFVAWTGGAHLVVPRRVGLLSAGRYLVDQKITCWFAVPSLAQQMSRQGALAEDAYPDLRISLFCGEPLPVDLAEAWRRAAPKSALENWYGPTEATISCTRYAWTAESGGRSFEHGLVPIGTPFPGMSARVFDDALRPVSDGRAGELLLSGSQVTEGYLNDPQRTDRSFCVPPGEQEVHYRSGDRATVDEHGQLRFLGRIDNQTKIQGYRVELGEIEAALRKACDGRVAVAAPWPLGRPNADAVVAAVEGAGADLEGARDALRERLPEHMVPRHLVELDAFPKNASGKVDRKAVGALVESRLKASGKPPGKAGETGATVEELVITAVRELQPETTREEILAADDLMSAGLDSLGFVELTRTLEEVLGIELTQHDVAFLVGLPVVDFVSALSGWEGRRTRKSWKKWKSKSPHRVRIQQFIELFPRFLDGADAPVALVVGSSGAMVNTHTAAFDEVASREGRPLRAVNAGLRGLTAEGLAQVCEFVRDLCVRSGRRLGIAVMELDPMLVSTKPPHGEHELVREILAGASPAVTPSDAGWEFAWALESAGTIEAIRATSHARAQKARLTPDWERSRNIEVAQAYLGQIEFDPAAVDAWLRGLRALAEVSDALAAFVVPVNPVYMRQAQRAGTGHHYTALLEEVRREAGIPVADHTTFDLAPEDFSNINHMNPWRGARVFTEQVASYALERAAEHENA